MKVVCQISGNEKRQRTINQLFLVELHKSYLHTKFQVNWLKDDRDIAKKELMQYGRRAAILDLISTKMKGFLVQTL